MTPFGCARSARTDPFTGISILADEQLRSDFSQLLTRDCESHTASATHPHTPKGATAHKATKLPLTPTLHTVTDCTLKLNLTHTRTHYSRVEPAHENGRTRLHTGSSPFTHAVPVSLHAKTVPHFTYSTIVNHKRTRTAITWHRKHKGTAHHANEAQAASTGRFKRYIYGFSLYRNKS